MPRASTSQEDIFQATTEAEQHSFSAHSSSFFSDALLLNDRSNNAHAPAPVKPSMLLLFSRLSSGQVMLFLLPAILASLIAGGIAPFMTLVIGQAFEAFSRFSQIPDAPSQDAKDQLVRSVGIAALELVALAVGALLLGTLTSSLWIWTGEHNVRALRKHIYDSVTKKEMTWFDERGAESTGSSNNEEKAGPNGAGGMVSRFTSEIEDVHQASSLAAGMAIQYLTTCITCLVLAFLRSWSLTLIVLASLPALIVVQVASQFFAGPLLASSRASTATAATLVERACAGIATVKAFNAVPSERAALASVVHRIRNLDTRLNAVWGASSALSQFVAMAMFVQAFWFGAKLVREGHTQPGDVMSVFWACLIATSNLQLCLPQFITLAKGKFAMAALLTLAQSADETSISRRVHQLQKIIPNEACQGEISMQDVSFSYPSRPQIPVLLNISLFLPARELTFIVGASGSGKSTIAQLILGMYPLRSGAIQLDDRDMEYLDSAYRRQHIACISQDCVLFDMSVHDNVAIALGGDGCRVVSREQVMEVCRAALMHEFINGLPKGYDTMLGNGGARLSGGQMQRLAIARALLRNPTTLILDEATSALDATSRLLVFEAIKHWRRNMTTIVITHDLSQIAADDFVYVLRFGTVGEQGYRSDLETAGGEFKRIMELQREHGGFLPEKVVEPAPGLEDGLREGEKTRDDGRALGSSRPLSTIGSWAVDFVGDLAKQVPPSAVGSKNLRRMGRYVINEALGRGQTPDGPPPYSVDGNPPPRPPRHPLRPGPSSSSRLLEEEAVAWKPATAFSDVEPPSPPANDAKPSRLRRTKLRKVRIHSSKGSDEAQSFFSVLLDVVPTIPHKFFMFVGLIICILNGAMTPLFSFLLSRLLFEVSIGGRSTAVINVLGYILLGVAAADGLFLGLKYFVMETTAMAWVTRMRKACFRLVLSQDKAWFDKSENSAARVVQILIQDGDDARALISEVLGQFVVVVTMLGLGLVWALVLGWQLTLVGFAIAPVFALAIAVQMRLVGACELRNKRAHEAVGRVYHEATSNIRAIRSMAFEAAFQRQFAKAADEALKVGVRSAFVVGCTYGLANALIYLAEALLFYVGAVLIARGVYSYLRMVQVLNLVVFSVTIASQLMAFTRKTAKSVQATRDFNRLAKLPTATTESRGILRPRLNGSIRFVHVTFAYPERPEVPVLRQLSLTIANGETVAIVGASGSGKSTIVALLQRLYEPNSGTILIGSGRLRVGDLNVVHLREHMSVVSQHPHLLDATIYENITYGSDQLSEADVRRAAKAANVHNFIMSLPRGYETKIGEDASLISGGQAQRLQIARAFARPCRILILDECTSALDTANQVAIMDTIRKAKSNRTTIVVTHNLAMMRMCDRIVVVDDGMVKEQGTYEDLMSVKGVFAQLTRSGEWVGER